MKSYESKASNTFDVFTVLASIFYIREAQRIKGWKPFTAQILSATISTLIDYFIAIVQKYYDAMPNPMFETLIGHMGSFGNLFVAICSFALGGYSMKWSLTDADASGVDICNSALVLVNGVINLLQAIAAFVGGKETFEAWDDWLKSLESLLGCIIMVITMCKVKEIG